MWKLWTTLKLLHEDNYHDQDSDYGNNVDAAVITIPQVFCFEKKAEPNITIQLIIVL